MDENGKVDVSQLPAGAMYTANGEWVIARPDEATWDKYQQNQKVSADQAKELEADQDAMRARGLECSIDQKMFVDPVKTPCCSKTYCQTCIENALIDSDFVCPNCEKQCLLEDLQTDDEMAKKVKTFTEEMKEQKQKKQAEDAAKKSPSATAGTPNADAKSPSPSGSRPGSSNGKKRAAEEELENTHKPAGPAAMQKSNSKDGTPASAPPTGPAASASANNNSAPTMPAAPKNMQEFIAQMNSMSGGMPMMNPMMMGGMNPMMMMGGMPNMGMMGGMPGMGFGGGFPQQQQFGAGQPPAGPKAWQQQQAQQQQWGMNGMGMGGMGGMGMNAGGMMRSQSGTPQSDGAYFRQPVNPGRHQNRNQRRQRSVDYKQMGQ